MRCAQAGSDADFGVVHPELSFPVRALQEKGDSFSLPGGGDIDGLLIPCGADVVLERSQPERHFDVAGLAVFGVRLVGEPGAVNDAARPLCIDGDVVAEAVLGGRAGQIYFVGQVFLEPLLGLTDIFRVELKIPLARKVNGIFFTTYGGQRNLPLQMQDDY